MKAQSLEEKFSMRRMNELNPRLFERVTSWDQKVAGSGNADKLLGPKYREIAQLARLVYFHGRNNSYGEAGQRVLSRSKEQLLALQETFKKQFPDLAIVLPELNWNEVAQRPESVSID